MVRTCLKKKGEGGGEKKIMQKRVGRKGYAKSNREG
jgi:hypothetical protein